MAQGVKIGRGYIAVDVDEEGARAALGKFGSVAATTFKAAAAATAVVSGAVVKMAFDFNSLKEQSLIAFETLLGGGDRAKAMFADLQKFAASTPFELPGLVDNARQLLGVGVAANKVIPTLTALGNTAGALGINQEHFNNILLAVTQSMGKGKLQGEELMQMVENGIPVWQLLAKATGKSIPELQKLSSEGKLLAAETLPKLFDQMQKDYGGAMAKQATTLSGVWSSLKDNSKSLAGTALAPLFDLVKSGVGVLGELAQSEAGQDFAQRFAQGIRTAVDVTGDWYNAVQSRFGDQIGAFFDRAAEKAGQLWDSFKKDGVPLIKELAQGAATLVPPLLQLAVAMGGILKPALEAARTVLQALSDNAGSFRDIIATAASVVSAVAGPVIKVFGEVLKVAADALALVVDFIGDIPGPLGVLTGALLAGLAAWRLLGPVISGVGAALSAVKPSTVADALAPLSKRVDNVALSAGVMTERFTGSANAGEKVAVAGSKLGTALTKVGAALPLVGIGVAAIGGLFELTAQRAEELQKQAGDIAKGLLAGGTAGQKAAKDLAALEQKYKDAAVALEQFKRQQQSNTEGGDAGVAAGQAQNLNDLKKAADDARGGVENLRKELGPLGVAQAQQAQAQSDYNAAIKDFGANSPQAIGAQKLLVAATRDVELAQRDAANATKSHEQSLYDLTTAALAGANADLQLRQSQAGVETSIKQLNDAVKEYGVGSGEAQQASLSLEQAMLRSAEAARQKAIADNNGKDSSVIAAAAQKAYADEILRMATAAGSNAPASLQKLVGGLSAAELQAIGARVKVDEFGNAIIQVPGQKDIVITAENAAALREIARVQDELAEAQKRAFITIQTRVANGLPGISDLTLKAVGGPIRPDGPYKVGEQGPEIIFPDRAGYVATAAQSKSILEGLNTNSGKIEQNNYFSAPMDEAAYATMATQRMAWMAKTGGR